ncbi:MAG: glycosyltransferase [Gemmatimonadales bacterium]|nr:glycosyltransferase [Gemmatimonadales bacterium]
MKAFHLVAEKHPEVRLRIIGHCPDRAPFELLAAGHPRVSLEKAVFRDEAHEILSRCRVYVLASRTEAMGRVLLEAMAAGRPIIASRVDGVPHYIQDGVNGLLFESENVAELAEKLDRLLSDAELRRTLGENGRRIVMEKYSEKEYARKMITMFYQVLGRDPPPELGATAD